MLRERYRCAPGDTCDLCRGRGYVRLTRRAAACWGCDGRATAGAFVVQIEADTFRYELRFQTRRCCGRESRIESRERRPRRHAGRT